MPIWITPSQIWKLYIDIFIFWFFDCISLWLLCISPTLCGCYLYANVALGNPVRNDCLCMNRITCECCPCKAPTDMLICTWYLPTYNTHAPFSRWILKVVPTIMYSYYHFGGGENNDTYAYINNIMWYHYMSSVSQSFERVYKWHARHYSY